MILNITAILFTQGKQWVWSKERLETAIKNNEVEFNKQKDGSYSVRAKNTFLMKMEIFVVGNRYLYLTAPLPKTEHMKSEIFLVQKMPSNSQSRAN